MKKLITISLIFYCSVMFGKNIDILNADQIYESSGIEKKNDKFFLVENKDIEVEPEIKSVDLNGDGIDEVFVMLNNYSGAYGNAEGNLILLIKGRDNKYQKNIDYPVSAYTILKNKFKGYPDIDLTIPGYCSSIWRWDGQTYNYYRKQCVKGHKEVVK